MAVQQKNRLCTPLAWSYYFTLPIHILYMLCILAASPIVPQLFIVQIGQSRIGYFGACATLASGCSFTLFGKGAGVDQRALAVQKQGLFIGMISILAAACIFLLTEILLYVRRRADTTRNAAVKGGWARTLEGLFWISAALGVAGSAGTMQMGWALQASAPGAGVQIGMPVMIMQWVATLFSLFYGILVVRNVGMEVGKKPSGSSGGGTVKPPSRTTASSSGTKKPAK